MSHTVRFSRSTSFIGEAKVLRSVARCPGIYSKSAAAGLLFAGLIFSGWLDAQDVARTRPDKPDDVDVYESPFGLANDVKLFSDNPVIRAAQMSPMFLFAEVEIFSSRKAAVADDPDTLDLTFSVFEPVIVINGRFSPRDEFKLRNRWGGNTKYKRFLQQIKFNGNSWLELSDVQLEKFEELIWTEPLPDEVGGLEVRHFGDDRLELHRIKWHEATSISHDEYRQMEREYGELVTGIDEELETRIKEILLPFQRERLQFAMGASQLHQMGIWHLLRYEMPGSPFRLKADHLAKLKEEVTRRRNEELKRLVRFEEAMLDTWSEEQRAAFDDVFGEPVEHLPTMMLSFSRGK